MTLLPSVALMAASTNETSEVPLTYHANNSMSVSNLRSSQICFLKRQVLQSSDEHVTKFSQA